MSEDSFPKAYKDGFKEFFGREFKVSPDVLIPRPETETMVEMVLSLAGKSYLPGVKVPESVLSKHPKILDVGTGSGCVAISLKLEIPEAEVYALDISKPALKVAEENAKRLKAKVNFFESDLLSNVPKDETFDVIVANLPYVDKTWPWIKSIEHEPEVALYAGDGGLELILKLLKQVQDRTKYLILEADPVQHDRIRIESQENQFKVLKTNNYQILLACDRQ